MILQLVYLNEHVMYSKHEKKYESPYYKGLRTLYINSV